MKQICDGLKSKNDMINETLDEYREMFIKTKQSFNVLTDVRL